MDTATLTPVSTAPASAPAAPESTAEVQVPLKPQSLTEKAASALKDFRASVKPDAGKPKTALEDVPAAKPGETTEEVSGTEPEAKVETPSTQPVLSENLEEISFNGQTVPLIEALENGGLQFEVYANEKLHPVDGLPKLLDLASIGIAAAEKNRIAKEAVAKADQTVQEVKASVDKQVQEGVWNQLNTLLANAKNGVNGDGKPFKDAGAQKRAVELLEGMKTASGNGNEAPKSLSAADIESLVQKKLEERLTAERKQTEDRTRVNQVLETAKSTLVEATKGDHAYFVKTDGKLNGTLFDSYRRSLTTESDAAWVQAGKPTDPKALKDIVAKVRAKLLPDFQVSNPSATVTEPKKAPLTPQSTGAGLLPKKAEGEQPFKGMTYAESIQERKRLLGLGKKR